ncbi:MULTISPECIES: M20 family metallopeptidase [Pantoea]|jgi:glutamate carboxypeptidase|uniref:M20 family metallopeptidase n=1 Tax=Pantoea eucrina TaxID=472693 RepID=A0ABS1Z5K8_9GAMM|nr:MULTISPECIES: M20 family metallopeptidase [Pantoea]AJA71055.1 peptidase M20 [Pantoea sp. PSNIH1]MBM0747557.1 M20 family metallopeptidase [Pantoea eucrina]MCL9648739.1 M20 family metallopeptidase [Pantoea eucrina]MDJ0023516.1 M20 family metallopeptidase [Pantoea eucrina]UBB15226.1 M20 family metallopeptidase [Pantoea eucrina]
MKAITLYLEQHAADILADIKTLVAAESPSDDKSAVDACGEVLQQLFQQRLNVRAEITPQQHYGNNLKFSLGGQTPQSTIIGHFDTVWNKGELTLREEEGRLYGPGILDMKAGLVQAIWAVRALQQLDLPGWQNVVFLCNSDEELGSPGSQQWIETHARGSAQVFVVEPAVAGSGALKVARKGTGRYDLTLTGLAAHAGNNPEEGASAVLEMAQQILALHALNAPERGTTVNVGVASGGSRANVVADRARLEVDTRVTSEEEAARLHAAIMQLQPHDPRVTLHISGEQGRPPMRQSAASRALFARAAHIGRQLGLTLEGASVGGGSDGNFTAALGLPTLDGLGATGAGIHARHEHIIVAEVVQRTALLAGLLSGETP